MFAYNGAQIMQRIAAILIAAALTALAQSPNWTLEFANHYSVQANITYLVASNYEDKLDLYERRDVPDVAPTVIYIHGGGGGLPLRAALGRR